ncbi:MAG: AAA family ATPase [Bacteroidota bacterium]
MAENNFVKNVHIENFKSIQSLDLEDCRRINLIIGRPNTGKSNILEAMGLLSVPYLPLDNSGGIKDLIRVENLPELFFNGKISEPAIVRSENMTCVLKYNSETDRDLNLDLRLSDLILKSGSKSIHNNLDFSASISLDLELQVYSVSSDGIGILLKEVESPVKSYKFDKDIEFKKGHAKYLISPNGSNLYEVIKNYPEVKGLVLSYFEELNLKVIFDESSRTIKLMKDLGNSDVFLLPYSAVADTLQRLIFYLAAIASNKNSILLFEEPEAHAFPPYMSKFSYAMMSNKDNQYFVATHSPNVLSDLLENDREELAVYMVYYENNETKVKRLTEEDLDDITQYSMDVFTNSESFI